MIPHVGCDGGWWVILSSGFIISKACSEESRVEDLRLCVAFFVPFGCLGCACWMF